MFWAFFFLSFFSLNFPTLALDIKWHGTTCLEISDGKSKILIDPFVTRPSLFQIIRKKEIKSDLKIVQSRFKKESGNLIIVSHTHYDHVLDINNLLTLWSDSTVYGPVNLTQIINQKHKLVLARDKKEIKHGDFIIKSHPVTHAPLVLNYDFAKEKMTAPLPKKATAFDYKAVENFIYEIIHPKMKILFHPAANDSKIKLAYRPDIMFLGGQKGDRKAILGSLLPRVKPKLIKPFHHDNFFKPLSEGLEVMPMTGYEDFIKEIKSKGFKVQEMKY